MSDSARVIFNTVSVSSGAFIREMNIVQRLADVADEIEYHVLCSSKTADELDEKRSNFHLHEVKLIENSLERPARTMNRLTWDNIALPYWVRRLRGDLLYFPLQITNLVDITPKVVAIHNIAPFYQKAQPDRRLYESFRLAALRYATRYSIRQAERVVFFTKSTLERIAQDVPAAREKGIVIPHGVPDGFKPKDPNPTVLDRYGLPEEFLLSVSNIARYKNHIELVTGYAKAAKQIEMPSLYLAGKTVDGDYAIELDRRIQMLGLSDNVHRIGFVDHDDLPDLHAASKGLVFNSACENAPITVIEAMACGTPIACSNATSLPELCGDAALYFDPDDPDDISRTLIRFVEDDEARARLADMALKRAERHSWDRAATQTHSVFRDVLDQSNG